NTRRSDRSDRVLLPLWTDFRPFGQVGVIDRYTLLVAVASALTLVVHGGLWLVLKTEGDLQERARRFAALCWTALFALMLAVTAASIAIQPNFSSQFRKHTWGAAFIALAVAGMIGERVPSRRRWDLQAFLASGLSIAGMLCS